jgi:hypothetical protein
VPIFPKYTVFVMLKKVLFLIAFTAPLAACGSSSTDFSKEAIVLQAAEAVARDANASAATGVSPGYVVANTKVSPDDLIKVLSRSGLSEKDGWIISDDESIKSTSCAVISLETDDSETSAHVIIIKDSKGDSRAYAGSGPCSF